MSHVCDVCSRPAPDTSICYPCEHELTAEVRSVSEARGLAWDLDLAISKQNVFRTSSGVSGGSDEPPIPMDERASAVSRALCRALDRWAGVVRRETGLTAPSSTPNLAELASWLHPRLGWLRHHADAAEAHREITTAVRMARRTVDRPADRHYAGPCDVCGADVYAREGASYVACQSPVHDEPVIWPAHERREWLLEAAMDVLATAPVIAAALTALDRPVTVHSIRGLKRRGKLTPRWLNDAGHELYLVKDVTVALEGRRKSSTTLELTG